MTAEHIAFIETKMLGLIQQVMDEEGIEGDMHISIHNVPHAMFPDVAVYNTADGRSWLHHSPHSPWGLSLYSKTLKDGE